MPLALYCPRRCETRGHRLEYRSRTLTVRSRLRMRIWLRLAFEPMYRSLQTPNLKKKTNNRLIITALKCSNSKIIELHPRRDFGVPNLKSLLFSCLMRLSENNAFSHFFIIAKICFMFIFYTTILVIFTWLMNSFLFGKFSSSRFKIQKAPNAWIDINDNHLGALSRMNFCMAWVSGSLPGSVPL